MHRFLLIFVSLVMTNIVQADVELKIKDGQGGLNTISSNGKKARIESKKMPGYVLVDFEPGEFLMVNPKRNEIISMTVSGGGSGKSDSVSISFKEKGGGPKIAGYTTRKFDYKVDGTPCGSVYLSETLLKNKAVQSMFDSMLAMQQQMRNMMGGITGSLGPCERASLELAESLGSNGAPLKMLDRNGDLVSEVVSVNTEKSISDGFYQAPAGMRRVSMEEMMGQAQQQAHEMMKNMPDVDELMQQLGDSGQMTEEMQQQMKKMQEMMKQLQQQQQ